MQDTILKFSKEELAALNDLNFFLLKHSATRKIVALFGEMEAEYKDILKANELNVDQLNVTTGKIFRGENYNQFPYIILDCPRLFNSESVFAYRTMMWWGNEFSFTLHLQGKSLDQFRRPLEANYAKLIGQDVFYCVNDTPWQYHYGTDNYVSVTSTTKEDFLKRLKEMKFIKLSRRVALDEYGAVKEKGKETLSFFLSLLK
jgi:hypothetical protein